jgi:hypothetical protein
VAEVKFPRYERVAAGLVCPAYVGLVTFCWLNGRSPLAASRWMFSQMMNLARYATAEELPSMRVVAGTTQVGLLTVQVVPLVQAFLRACGLRGFLGNRAGWWWIAAHAGLIPAIPMIETAFSGSFYRFSRYFYYNPADLIMLGAYLAIALLSAYVLWRGRKQTSPEPAP